jgi:hypothetical protein
MTVVIDQPISALSVRIFSMLTKAAPGSTCTLTSGTLLLITWDTEAANGVQLPPVGPAEKMTSVFCWAWAAPTAPAASKATANTPGNRPTVNMDMLILPRRLRYFVPRYDRGVQPLIF